MLRHAALLLLVSSVLASGALAEVVGAFASLEGDVILEASERFFAVRVAPGHTVAEARDSVRATPGLGEHQVVVFADSQGRMLLELNHGGLPAQALRGLEQAGTVAWAVAGAHTPDGRPIGLTDGVVVLGQPQAGAALAEAVHALGLSLRGVRTGGAGWLVSVPGPTREKVLAICETLKGIKGVTDAHPDFLRVIARRKTLNDPLLAHQWYLGTAQAQKAWDTTIGDPNVIVAVIDDGFDMSHEDLAGKVAVGAWDFQGSDANPQAGSWDDHGTAVAGIAVAAGNNGKGISGVCPACSFLPIRQGNTDWSIVQAFDHVGDAGAHVVNNSWGFYYPSSSVTNGIQSAVANGRGGLGTMVVFASGNENADIDAVQDISAIPGVIAVGASTQWDTKASYSNYGKSLDLAAPSDGQYTTDKTNGGYSSGAYTSDFGGTSGAAPVVSGGAGLLFSLLPTMTEAEARELLFAGADKVGGGYDKLGKSLAMGHGRLNLAKSVALYGGAAPAPVPSPGPEPAPVAGSCAGQCGAQAAGACWCDSGCAKYGDCCADACSQCGFGCTGPSPEPEPQPAPQPPPSPPGPDSCAGKCGGQAAGGCWCDSECAKYGDCCADACKQCGVSCPPAAEPEPQPVPTAEPEPDPEPEPEPEPEPAAEPEPEPAAEPEPGDTPAGDSNVDEPYIEDPGAGPAAPGDGEPIAFGGGEEPPAGTGAPPKVDEVVLRHRDSAAGCSHTGIPGGGPPWLVLILPAWLVVTRRR